jgi:hypothetical protein
MTIRRRSIIWGTGGGGCLSSFAEQTDLFLEQVYDAITPDEAKAVLRGALASLNITVVVATQTAPEIVTIEDVQYVLENDGGDTYYLLSLMAKIITELNL